MGINESLIGELEAEAAATKRILEAVPSEKFDWKPHPKSMSLKELTIHIVHLSGWVNYVVNKDELDIQTLATRDAKSTYDLVAIHEELTKNSLEALKTVTDEQLFKNWTLRFGSNIILELPKIGVIRSICYNHTYHHRGQLGVYLRLLNVKVPGIYGPSADDN